MQTTRALGRREFLKQSAQAAAALAVSVGMASAAESAESSRDSVAAIPATTLGKTGLKLPILGYGGAALPKAWLNPLSLEDRIRLVRYAFDRGIRYFDTAGAIRHVLQDQRIHVLNIGMRLKEEIDTNIKVLTGDTTYTLEDRWLLADFSARLYDTDAIRKLKTE